MILVDTSVWVDHLRAGNERLGRLLNSSAVLCHPFVIGELALGTLHQRDVILSALSDLPLALVATDAEVLSFIERHTLSGCGIGYVDVHLLASARLSGARLWAQDKALHETAARLDLAAAAGCEPGRDRG